MGNLIILHRLIYFRILSVIFKHLWKNRRRTDPGRFLYDSLRLWAITVHFHMAVCRLFPYAIISFSSWARYPALPLAMVWISCHRTPLSFYSLDRDALVAYSHIYRYVTHFLKGPLPSVPSGLFTGDSCPSGLQSCFPSWSPELSSILAPPGP